MRYIVTRISSCKHTCKATKATKAHFIVRTLLLVCLISSYSPSSLTNYPLRNLSLLASSSACRLMYVSRIQAATTETFPLVKHVHVHVCNLHKCIQCRLKPILSSGNGIANQEKLAEIDSEMFIMQNISQYYRNWLEVKFIEN